MIEIKVKQKVFYRKSPAIYMNRWHKVAPAHIQAVGKKKLNMSQEHWTTTLLAAQLALPSRMLMSIKHAAKHHPGRGCCLCGPGTTAIHYIPLTG